jgi:hypothetical protein
MPALYNYTFCLLYILQIAKKKNNRSLIKKKCHGCWGSFVRSVVGRGGISPPSCPLLGNTFAIAQQTEGKRRKENIKAYFFLMLEPDWRPTGSLLSFGLVSQRQ